MTRTCKGCTLTNKNYNKHPLMCDSCVDIYVAHENEVDTEMRSLYGQEFNLKSLGGESAVIQWTRGDWINHHIDTIRFWKRYLYKFDEISQANDFTGSFTLKERARILYVARHHRQAIDMLISTYEDDPDALRQFVDAFPSFECHIIARSCGNTMIIRED